MGQGAAGMLPGVGGIRPVMLPLPHFLNFIFKAYQPPPRTIIYLESWRHTCSQAHVKFICLFSFRNMELDLCLFELWDVDER